MRIGITCPYSFEVPGGVQYHVRDLAEYLIQAGHEVSVLAPADDHDDGLPDYLVPAGRAVPVRYNGSVARVNFGVVVQTRVTRWLESGDFDLLHLHEPVSPSVSLLALWGSHQPTVGTFHSAQLRSRAMLAANPLLRSSLEKLRGRIAVSEEARLTVRRHLGGDAFVIPNGVDVASFADADPDPAFQGGPDAPTIAFLGRVDEPRKGLTVLLDAWPAILAAYPGARLLVAGPGRIDDLKARLPGSFDHSIELLGGISDEDKRRFLRSVDLYVAPQTGGESFGIVLVEAMAAGVPVLASDLPAFADVLDQGAAGRLFARGDPDSLAREALAVLGDEKRRADLVEAGHRRCQRYDWASVGGQLLAVFETAIEGVIREPELPESRLWARLTRRGGIRA